MIDNISEFATIRINYNHRYMKKKNIKKFIKTSGIQEVDGRVIFNGEDIGQIQDVQEEGKAMTQLFRTCLAASGHYYHGASLSKEEIEKQRNHFINTEPYQDAPAAGENR